MSTNLMTLNLCEQCRGVVGELDDVVCEPEVIYVGDLHDACEPEVIQYITSANWVTLDVNQK